MRHTLLLVALLATGLLMTTGCKKQNTGPQTSEVAPPPAAPDNSFMTEPPPPPPTAAPGYTQAPAAPVATPAPMGARTHVVKPGETLWKISAQYYGKGSRANVDKIVAANPGMNPDRIKVGQQIVIPD